MKNKKSKVQIIKEAFESGSKLTALDAWKLCRSLCLAEIVRHLKKYHSMKIVAEYKVEKGCRFAVYQIAKKVKKGAK